MERPAICLKQNDEIVRAGVGLPSFEKTQIGSLVYETRKENNPCSLCANMRRGALVNVAKKIGCNKVALAHNREDVMETLLMSMFFEGRIHTFSPVTYMDRKDVHIIRPFVFCNEQDIKEYAMQNGFPVLKNPCCNSAPAINCSLVSFIFFS